MSKLLKLIFVSFVLMGWSSHDVLANNVVAKPSPSKKVIINDKLKKVSDKIPSFAGVYLDDAGNINVLLTDAPTAKKRSAYIKGRKGRKLKKALVTVYGHTLFIKVDPVSKSKIQRKLILRKAKYTYRQLDSWYGKYKKIRSSKGIVFTDIDEKSNRITIGIKSEAHRKAIVKRLRSQGIPVNAVQIKVTSPIYFQEDLRDRIRPNMGGIQISDGGGFCTMSFNAVRGGTYGFLTNSHCTRVRGQAESTIHQPSKCWLPIFCNRKIGEEIVDPPFFTQNCPANRVCRFSDSAFIRHTRRTTQNFRIARTRTQDNGTLELDRGRRSFQVAGIDNPNLQGTVLHRVGRTTGWRSGTLSATCIDVNVANSNITLLCQNQVSRRAGETLPISNPGDSGSPFFSWNGSIHATIVGIHWGGSGGTIATFSPISQVEQEIGALRVVAPPPPPPPSCSAGQKCCWITAKNRCWCIPDNRSCPPPDENPFGGCRPGQVCCEPGLNQCKVCASSSRDCPIPK